MSTGRMLSVRRETWPLARTFRLSRGARTSVDVVVVEIEHNGLCGRGEGSPIARYGQSAESCIEAIDAVREAVEAGAGRHELMSLMGPSSARNAVDCALWDLEAKLADTPVWRLAGLDEPAPVVTAYTIVLDTPQAMGEEADASAHRPLLKVKLDGERVVERVASVRQGAPAARLIVDANEAWDAGLLREVAPELKKLKVEMIEQPLPAARDAELADLACGIALCADESCHVGDDVPRLAGRYDMVNVKLDKAGGLTAALALRRAALDAGFQVMVGCMIGTSLAMAPALLVAQGAALVDLDGPLFLEADRASPIAFAGSTIFMRPREAAAPRMPETSS